MERMKKCAMNPPLTRSWFHDMQSTARSFEKYLGITLPRSRELNDIIVGQACRNVVVHNAGIVDRKLLGKLRNAEPRRLHVDLCVGEAIELDPEFVSNFGSSLAS